jgi:hypothetical protein
MQDYSQKKFLAVKVITANPKMKSAVQIPRGPLPNRGTTIDAVQTIANHQSLEEWRAQAGIETSNQVQLVKLSHMRYQHKDVDKITTFMLGQLAHSQD